ncbi:hypothetical protein [Agrobacterium tumefaciens]|uniref:hypothetical protein n=1 Tax=Agrobacterium tumefaciens TaxID=358 RepID=UPI001F350E18|nr:hypothetical protein [Agrobacterium tumefaciens]WCJ61896.1 hypothetical protein G6M15_10695 [Agrobacterium tumefaciens]
MFERLTSGLRFLSRGTAIIAASQIVGGNLNPALAFDAESRALWGASAMAEADYHRNNPCAQWTVDEEAVKKVIAWSGQTLAQLRASDDYREQREAIKGVVQQYGIDMACDGGGANFTVGDHDYGVLRHAGW